jgi:hypothetical protein
MADKEKEVLFSIIGTISIISIIVGISIFGWQIFTWLKNGYWVAIPLSIGLEYIGFSLSSIYFPSDWHGVMKIIRWFLNWPLSLCLPIISAAVCYIPALIVVDIIYDTKNVLKRK